MPAAPDALSADYRICATARRLLPATHEANCPSPRRGTLPPRHAARTPRRHNERDTHATRAQLMRSSGNAPAQKLRVASDAPACPRGSGAQKGTKRLPRASVTSTPPRATFKTPALMPRTANSTRCRRHLRPPPGVVTRRARARKRSLRGVTARRVRRTHHRRRRAFYGSPCRAAHTIATRARHAFNAAYSAKYEDARARTKTRVYVTADAALTHGRRTLRCV